MLISPPFLVAQAANQTEHDWINTCMAGGAFGDGGFPVSAYLGWHGGLHLDAPMNGNVAEQVRAIADGTIVYVRQPTERPEDTATPHPQMYRGQWTDNGLVIIRHDTEIGEGDNGKVSFFSVYMHLRHIESTLAAGRNTYRKAVIGDAGHIYGVQNKIHFEIICDDANLARLTGRAHGDLALTTNGRTNAIYGQMYFHLPAGTPVFAEKPLDNNASAMRQPPTQRGQPKPPAVALQASYTSTEALIVGLRYAQGQGDANSRGSAYLCTFQLDGSVIGPASNSNATPPDEATAALPEANAEYNLYTRATQISEAYPTGARPAPSAVYELLRFGRVIGPDALTPATVPHWREVRYPGGRGWVNLNGANIHKFSDADFPHWRDWKHIADDADPDCRCDSALLKGLLRNTPNEQLTDAELRARAALPTKAEKLKKTICKFPTEWDASTVDVRWGWLKTVDANPLSDADFEVLRAHVTAMAFWQAASPRLVGPPGANNAPGTPLPATHWHFEPREFIRHFRMCGWLSAKELNRIYPDAKFPTRALTTEGLGRNPNSVRDMYRPEINKVIRKYLINSPIRMTHFFGQGAVESMYLCLMVEGSANFSRNPTHASFQPETNGYYNPVQPNYLFYLENRLGNIEAGDGPKFRGRGMKQLTGRENYSKYWVYRGWLNPDSFRTPWWNPARPNIAPNINHPENLSLNSFNAIDAGGWYWEAGASSNGFRSINSIITNPTINRNSVREVARAINGINRSTGDPNGLVERLTATEEIAKIIMDTQ